MERFRRTISIDIRRNDAFQISYERSNPDLAMKATTGPAVRDLITAASREVLDERLRARFQQQMQAELRQIEVERVKP